MNAAPVAFLQFPQWHTRIVTGSPVTSYLTARHKHDPVRVMGAVDSEEGGGPEEAMMCENEESLGE